MLFDKTGFYLLDDQNKDYDFAVDIINANFDRPKLYDATEGLEKGNMFPELYDPYKNYVPGKLKCPNERAKKLVEIQKLDFAIDDLNLYLDMYPDDMYAYKTFKKYVMECKTKKKEFTDVYGPLCLDELTEEYEWSKGVWPWEEGGI